LERLKKFPSLTFNFGLPIKGSQFWFFLGPKIKKELKKIGPLKALVTFLTPVGSPTRPQPSQLKPFLFNPFQKSKNFKKAVPLSWN